MKRFFCITCQKVRRARFIPVNVETPNATDPGDRIGYCGAHNMGISIARYVSNERPTSQTIKKIKSTVSVPVVKKGRK